jgi:hypothetical protein
MLTPQQILYTALFVDDPKKLLQMFPARHEKTFAHHSTNWFKPTSIEGLEIGKKSLLKIIGQASDDKGFAILVKNPKSTNKYPHITISCANGVPPAYSEKLLEKSAANNTIEFFKEPFFIEVTEGYNNFDNSVITSID